MRSFISFVMIVALFMAGLAPARAGTPALREQLTTLAKEVAEFLKDQDDKTISLGQFIGPAHIGSTGGPGIIEILSDELRKQGIKIQVPSKLTLQGKFHLDEVPSPDPNDTPLKIKVLALTIEAEFVNAFGKSVNGFDRKLTFRDEPTIIDVTGATVEPSNEPLVRKRDEEYRRRLVEKPQVAIAGTRVSAKAGSPFAIELLVGGKARAAEDKNGLAFIGIKRGETYAVRLINDSNYEAAVNLSIDGISMFAFSEVRIKEGPKKGQPKFSVVIVPPRKQVVIVGWHVNQKISDKFLVTDYAKSAAALLKTKDKLGTITARFAAAWKEDEQPPSDEPGKARGTGFGERVESPYVEVRRHVGAVRAAISVRYEKPGE